MQTEFDVLVVGAGAAGCVVASRLSANPHLRICLVESGKDYGYDTEPAAIQDTYARAWSYPQFLWPGLKVMLRPGLPEIGYSQGHLVGGGSAVMGMHAMRGMPGDYDEWAALGASGWDWEGVRPYFLRLERDLDCHGPEHGDDGPISIWRQKPERMPPFARAAASAFVSCGYAGRLDVNGSAADGVYPMPFNATAHRRVTTPYAYLDLEVRKRPNLTILSETKALRLLFDGRRATGIDCVGRNGRTSFRARQIILACGALQTPLVLQRSGIGPGRLAQDNGIEMVVEARGVGENLLNHPILPVAARLHRGVRHPRSVRPHVNSLLRYSSGVAGCPPGDMYVAIMGTTAWHSVGRTIGALAVSVYKAFSRGHVRVRGAEGLDREDICINTLDDERDRLRMGDGLARMLSAMAHPAMAPLVSDVFLPGETPWIRRLSEPRLRNRLLSAAASLAMDVVPGAQSRLLNMTGRRLHQGIPADELRSIASAATTSMYHPAGTCRLGAEDDPYTVVLPDCRVRGLEGLSIADASIMPTIPRANTFLTSVMIGEKAADLIRARLTG